MADDTDRAYVAGLTMLGRRELCAAQVRSRLARRAFEPEAIEGAVQRLVRERALDDRRTAVACARTEVRLKHRGRRRVLRQLEAIGISSDVARDAVSEVFTDLDEDLLIEGALDRRLRGAAVIEPAHRGRLYRYLLAQGFDADRVSALLRRRAKAAAAQELAE